MCAAPEGVGLYLRPSQNRSLQVQTKEGIDWPSILKPVGSFQANQATALAAGS